MKLYAPKYYKTFRCIADRCEHSCCIGWEIDIDPRTLQKYQTMDGGYSSAIRESISLQNTPHFQLAKHDRCPHLDEHGLCKIITHAGEDFLCDICREHPRFYNYTSVAELGIGISCPEAARVVLSSADYAVYEEIGEVEAAADEVEFDGRAEREKIYAILQSAPDYQTALDAIQQTYSIDTGEDADWRIRLEGLEYLNEEHKPLFASYSTAHRPSGADEVLERFLAYLIYRHCTEAFDADDFCDRLTFCLFCERLLASMIEAKKASSFGEMARLASIISEEIEYSDENTVALM